MENLSHRKSLEGLGESLYGRTDKVHRNAAVVFDRGTVHKGEPVRAWKYSAEEELDLRPEIACDGLHRLEEESEGEPVTAECDKHHRREGAGEGGTEANMSHDVEQGETKPGIRRRTCRGPIRKCLRG